MRASLRHRWSVWGRLVGAAGLCLASGISGGGATPTQGPAANSLVGAYRYLGQQPPTPADCAAQGFRCFGPQAIQNTYDLPALYAQGFTGAGQTIAIVDSFGSNTIQNDLNVFDTAFSLPHLCGEANYACQPGDPTFKVLEVQGSPPAISQPPSHGTGQENHALWNGEVTLDVEWSHSVAPKANIILVTTPTAETLGVQGLPQMMAAEDYVVTHHLAAVISQSFASAEEAFASTQSLLRLRYAYVDAVANHVTVLGSAGDTGTANIIKTPVKHPRLIPFPTVEWPASDPLVTGVGGTSVCTDAATGLTVDSASPPPDCQNNPGQREVAWNNTVNDGVPIATGGGFSHVFSRPTFQDGTVSGPMRGVPDVAYGADPFTGVLVYISASGNAPGWYAFGGTSAGSPQWAGLIAIASQINGAPIGYINPALYKIGNDPVRYAADFHDISVGNNQVNPAIAGFSAGPGWDAVTGWGTPDAAHLLPDLVAAVNGH
jgi:subtilase family serine protease